jgi:hypothetical protein
MLRDYRDGMSESEATTAPEASKPAMPAFGDDLRALVPLALGVYAMRDSEEWVHVKSELRAWAKRDPIDALVTTVVGGGIAFYLAEHSSNPNCPTPWDGILYMSTALSVGYDNTFPTTPAGHALATFAQTFGPALANAALEPPAAETPAPVDREILAKLDEIAQLLRERAPAR